MAEHHADQGTRQHGEAVRRRGLIAGVAALVAGVIATKTSEAVGATDGSALIVGQTNTTVAQTFLGGDYSPVNNGNQPMFFVQNTSQRGSAIEGQTTDGTGFGVFAMSALGTGLYGGVSATGGSSSIGIKGENLGQGDAIHGVAGNANFVRGVYGSTTSTSGVGVLGTSPYAGVNGQGGMYGVLASSNHAGGAALYGTAQSGGAGGYGISDTGIGLVGQCDAANGTGVQGISNAGIGIFGASNGNTGIIGTTTKAGFAGLGGIVGIPGTAAFAGTATVAGAFAGFFTGDVFVNGNFTVNDPTKKHGAIQAPNGDHHILYSMESPEPWLEDFGKSRLVGGKGAVQLDPLFASVVHTEDYQVFLTEYGETNGLYVSKQTASGFEVQERHQGTASGMFGWRVLVKPKTANTAERLAKFAIPTITVPQPPPMPHPPSLATPPKSA